MKEWNELADLILHLECLTKFPIETDDIMVDVSNATKTPTLYLRVGEYAMRPVFAGNKILVHGKWEETIISYLRKMIDLMVKKLIRHDGVDPATVELPFTDFKPIEISDELFLELKIKHPNAAKTISNADRAEYHLIPAKSRAAVDRSTELGGVNYIFIRDMTNFAVIYTDDIEQLRESSGIKFIPAMLKGYV